MKKDPRRHGPQPRIPRFKSEAEEARFWDTHSPFDYPGEFEDADEVIRLAPALARRIRERMKKRLLAIRLEGWQIEGAKRIARDKGVPYQALMREWISQGIRAAGRPKKKRARA